MIEGYCPLRQELYTSCPYELIRVVQRRTVPLLLLYRMLSRRETIWPTVTTYCMFGVTLPVHYLIFVLARTLHQYKFLRMFPSPLPS